MKATSRRSIFLAKNISEYCGLKSYKRENTGTKGGKKADTSGTALIPARKRKESRPGQSEKRRGSTLKNREGSASRHVRLKEKDQDTEARRILHDSPTRRGEEERIERRAQPGVSCVKGKKLSIESLPRKSYYLIWGKLKSRHRQRLQSPRPPYDG